MNDSEGHVGGATVKAKIAMIGSRGIPARYGGVETVVDVAARELVRRGHDVTVFCRRGDYDERPTAVDGVQCVYLRVPEIAGLAALMQAAAATLWALPRRYDVYHYHALGPGLVAFLPRFLTRSRVVQTVHGRDDKRAKWGRGARAVLRLGAISSAHVPHQTLVVSQALSDEYEAEFGRATSVVPNATGAPMRGVTNSPPERFGLEAGRYAVAIGRLVPEKAAHELIAAIVGSGIDLSLAVVGGSAGTDDYADELRRLADGDDRIVFTGPVYGDELAELLCGSACFVTASHLEGLPTALIEAGRSQTPCLASDIAPHLEILGPENSPRWTFRTGDQSHLIEQLEAMLANIDDEKRAAVALARDLDDRFSVTRAGDAHELAYGLVSAAAADAVIDLAAIDLAAIESEEQGARAADGQLPDGSPVAELGSQRTDGSFDSTS